MYKILLSISLCLAPVCLHAQNAEDYFHGGAKSYIWGKDKEAETNIFTGLRLYPQDPLLNGMAGLLQEKKQEQEQNPQQQDQQQQQQQQAQQAQQDQKQEQQQPQQTDQQKQEQEQQQAAQQPQPEKQEQQQAQQSPAEPKDGTDEKEQQPASAQDLAQMTPEQARQLLDAQKGDEQLMPIRPDTKPQDRTRPFKDW